MKKNNFNWLVVLLVAAIPWVYLFIIWKDLPATIPMHFGLDGQPDAFGAKNSIILAPAILTVVTLLVYLLLNIVAVYNDKNNQPGNAQTLAGLSVVLVLFLAGVDLLILYWVKQGKVTGLPVLFVGLCLLLAYIGNRMHSIKPNHFMGFRLPWALKNENVWRKTHQFSSKLWFFGNIILAVVLLFLTVPAIIFVFVGAQLVMIAISTIYSYNLHVHINR